jgi:DNA-binding transcriptional LysR family regulator
MNPTFDIEALRAMALGAELGSFARAATRLGRSQSAISMQMKKLEQQAGTPLFQKRGRGLVPTEAGEALLAFARRIVALNDEAAASLGAAAPGAAVRLGLPQDLFEDVMPEALERFAQRRPGLHVEVRAGRNHVLEEEVRAGRLDVALAFFRAGAKAQATRLASLPLFWLGKRELRVAGPEVPLPLVLFDHPCLFRQGALQVLERAGRRWRLALTTPSLPGVWAALLAGHGLTVRTAHRVPAGLENLGGRLGLPALPPIELRMLAAGELSPAAAELRAILAEVAAARLAPARDGALEQVRS